jgi:hypothetical protein
VGVRDPLAAYLLDSAVVALGTVIENALAETIEVGPPNKRERRRKYTLAQLLDPAFHLPEPERPQRGISAFKQWARQSGGAIQMVRGKSK